jgi:hypothetical protein
MKIVTIVVPISKENALLGTPSVRFINEPVNEIFIILIRLSVVAFSAEMDIRKRYDFIE